MKPYSVEFSRSSRKELEKLAATVVPRVIAAIRKLQENPRPRGCRKLADEEATFRIRVGDYRVVYDIDDQSRRVVILRIRHRSRAYE